MHSRSRKLTAWLFIALGGAVVVATVTASRDLILERIYVWRLDSEDPGRREAAAQGLIELGSARVAPYLIEKFGETLEHHGLDGAAFEGTPVMDMVIRRGVDPQRSGMGGVSPEFYRLQSLLLEIAKSGPATEEYFLAGLEEESPATRALCAFLLGETGTRSEQARAALQGLLKDDYFVRTVAIVVLGKMGLESAPLLIQALDDHGNRRRAAVWALEEIGVLAVPHLIDALKNGPNAVPIYAAYLLGRIGSPASTAVPALAAILGDDTTGDTLRARAAAALRSIGGPDVVATFGRFLDASGGKTRDLAAYSLSQLGSPGVGELVEALGREDAGLRAAVVSALGTVDRASKVVVPALVGCLEDPDASVRREAIAALESFRHSEDDVVRRIAEGALSKVGGEAPRPRRRPTRRFQ